MINKVLKLAAVAALVMPIVAQARPIAAQALPTYIVEDNVLVGATGIDVNGALYDVLFVDGECTALYDGCDEASDFDFQSADDALAASAALLNQLLVDFGSGRNSPADYDSNPLLTAGCENPDVCIIITPYAIGIPGSFLSADADNWFFEADSANLRSWGNFVANGGNEIMARWSAQPVPEPATFLLMSLGLICVGFARQRGQFTAS